MTSPNDSATARRRIVILSDLHLSIGTLASVVAGEPPEFFFHDEPLAALIDELWDDGVDTLLLLGDLFELPGGVAPGHLHGRFHDVHIDDLVGRLDRIVAGHKPVFEALGRYLARGGRIDLVPGNHDLGLHHPTVLDRLRGVLTSLAGSELAGERMSLHPWVFHVPGLLYAEHGHQHHVLNSFVSPEKPWSEQSDRSGVVRLEDPVGAALHRAHLARRSPDVSVVRLLPSVLGSALANSYAQLRYHADSIPISAAGAIPASTLRTAHRASRITPWRFARAVVSKLLDRRPGRRHTTPPEHYLHRAAALVHSHLAHAGVAVPIYAFGHAHRPEALVLGNGTSYLNSGTWADWGQDPAGVGHARLPYGVVWIDEMGIARCAVRWKHSDSTSSRSPIPGE